MSWFEWGGLNEETRNEGRQGRGSPFLILLLLGAGAMALACFLLVAIGFSTGVL